MLDQRKQETRRRVGRGQLSHQNVYGPVKVLEDIVLPSLMKQSIRLSVACKT